VATLDKALLDVTCLHPGADAPDSLCELRLQNFEQLDLGEMQRLAQRLGNAKLRRVASLVAELARADGEEHYTL
jgi:hypothetical protein